MCLDRQMAVEAASFTKLIYLMTLFLDGKEINDLLTTLIHAFENIASFLDVMRQKQIPCSFRDKYDFFTGSADIARQLRYVNSFARMTKETIAGKLIMFEDAARILGTDFSAEELRPYIEDNILDKEKLRRLPGTKNPDTGFRNFIISNVIESRQFRYVVRYGNPLKLREYMDCRPLVEYVLNELPDSLLQRYFELYFDNILTDRKGRVRRLADMLVGLRFTDFENVQQRENALENRDKQQKKAIISLYLNVLYQIIKNLVYINSRYTMAFFCRERDKVVLGSKDMCYDGLARESIEKRAAEIQELEKKSAMEGNKVNGRILWKKKRVHDYLESNLLPRVKDGKKEEVPIITEYRNMVEHLSVVRNGNQYISGIRRVDSWFSLYHYLMQRLLADRMKNRPDEDMPKRVKEYFAKTEEHGTYSMDFVKVLNMPFAYNLPRYKTLSIDGQFDKNRPGKKLSVRSAHILPLN